MKSLHRKSMPNRRTMVHGMKFFFCRLVLAFVCCLFSTCNTPAKQISAKDLRDIILAQRDFASFTYYLYSEDGFHYFMDHASSRNPWELRVCVDERELLLTPEVKNSMSGTNPATSGVHIFINKNPHPPPEYCIELVAWKGFRIHAAKMEIQRVHRKK